VVKCDNGQGEENKRREAKKKPFDAQGTLGKRCSRKNLTEQWGRLVRRRGRAEKEERKPFREYEPLRATVVITEEGF